MHVNFHFYFIYYTCNNNIMHVTFTLFTFFLCFYTKHNDGPFDPKHVAHFHVFHSVRCELIYKLN